MEKAIKKTGLIFKISILFSVCMFFIAGTVFAIMPQYGGILKISRAQESRGLGNPSQVKTGELFIAYPCVEGLLKLDNNGTAIPNLALSYDLDTAAKTLTMKLKKGVKFHDGTDFNAEAVKFNIQTIGPESGIRGRVYEFMTSIDVIDDYTVRFNLKRWSLSIIDSLAVGDGLMISPAAYKKWGKEKVNEHPVGTGPFKFVKWDRDVMIKYAKFDDYYEQGKPYLDGIEIYVIKDPMTQNAAFLSGEHHIMLGVSAQNAKQLENNKKFRITTSPGNIYMISGDGIHPDSPWSNLKVRQAMFYAIDRQAIADAFGYGYWTVSPKSQFALPGTIFDNPNVKGYEYNPAKAKKLLAEAGYPNGFDTNLLGHNQPQFIVDYLTAIQGQLQAVGIRAKLDLMDPAREFQIQVGGGWHNGILNCYTSYRHPAIAYFAKYKRGGVFHKDTARPADFQDLVEAAMQAPDEETLTKDTLEIQKMLVDKYAITDQLFHIPTIAAKVKYVHDDYLAEDLSHAYWKPEDAWLSK